MAGKGVYIPCIDVSAEQADHFIRCISHEVTMTKKWTDEKLHLFDYENKAIIISIDGKWKPFLGFSYGLNPPAAKVHINESIDVIEDVIVCLYDCALDIPGGRIFITKHQAFRKEGNEKKQLCTFNWQGEDPYWAIKNVANF